ncbi:putative peptidoglycan lipid II flippase [Desulfitispora alkaliphila]|uniref:murein biosynthesis integral membrane protein MurJ n=1 Tax=Desulfitispora alkaliphila TaxID=622674 RepID=UPI003D1ADED4
MNGRAVAKAAGVIMIAMILSRILGYARDVVIYTQFGQNRMTDAYNAAFAIPDFLSLLLMGGAFSSAFIPVFTSYIAKGQEEEGWQVVSIVFNIVFILLIIGITLGFIFTPALIPLVAIGFHNEPETTALTVKMTRIMFGQAFFISIAGIAIGILNSYKKFTAPAIGGVAYNLGIIVFGVLLAQKYGIVGFAIGVVIGALLNLAIQIPPLIKLGMKYTFSFDWRHPGVKKIGLLMFPMMISLAVAQVNLIVNQNLASLLPEGIVSALKAAQRIMQLPIGIFAIAIAVAVFPTLTELIAKGKTDDFKRTMSMGVRTIVFITLPVAVLLLVLRIPVVRLLFEQGQFTPEATEATAYALFFYSFGIFAYSAIQVLNRSFYSLQDTKTPVMIAISTIFLNLILNLILIRPLGHGGLALAYSIAGVYSMGMLLWFLRRKLGGIDGKNMIMSFVKTGIASVALGITAYGSAGVLAGTVDVGSKLGQFIQVAGASTVAGLTFLIIAKLLKMEELNSVLDVLMRRFKRRRG